jgi:guanylate kinase
MSQGKLIVITGPSGVGKGTLIAKLRDRHPEIFLSVSATTRQPRDGEIDSQQYYFYDRAKFEKAIADGEMLEWAEYANNYYGTPASPVKKRLEKGEIVLLEIELLGARQVAKSFPAAVKIFILPPDIEELERRLRERNSEDEATIERRLSRSRIEIAAADEFEVKIVNDDLEVALEVLEKVIF